MHCKKAREGTSEANEGAGDYIGCLGEGWERGVEGPRSRA
jgi:hypothetical protein